MEATALSTQIPLDRFIAFPSGGRIWDLLAATNYSPNLVSAQ